MGKLIYIPIKEEKKKCLCCGKDIFVFAWEKDFCDSCCSIVCKEVFNPQNDNLTSKELRNKIKTFI